MAGNQGSPRGASRPHIVMVTNHGIHEWEVRAGLPDTGGQNVYVNDLSATLARLGFRVTIANRGGYPHPVTGEMRTGVRERGGAVSTGTGGGRGSGTGTGGAWDSRPGPGGGNSRPRPRPGRERIVYLTDSSDAFVRKEDMGPHVEELGRGLADMLARDGGPIAAFVSHYWDGAMVAETARRLGDAQRAAGGARPPHVWIPHSLGALKKQGSDPGEWESLRIEERIAAEHRILGQVDQVACTSSAMRTSLAADYGHHSCLFLPPCVDTRRFDPAAARADRSAVALLAEATGCSEADVRRARIITEVSRTDHTKRKDVLIRAFARVHAACPDTLLAVTIDAGREELYCELTGLIGELGLSGAVAVLGSVWEYVPSLYGMSAVYCTPSMMEGFGMSIQEAAACGVPAVASSRVPFAVEYLRGETTRHLFSAADGSPVEAGEGAVIVAPESVEATAEALILLLSDEALRREMGERAHEITVPRFTWETATAQFLRESGIGLPDEESAR